MVICALLVGGLTTFDSSLLALALPPLVYLAAAVVLRPTELQLQVEGRVTPTSAKPGEFITVGLRAENSDGRLEELEIQDQVPPGLEPIEGASNLICSMPFGGRQLLSYRLLAKTGLHTFTGARLSATDPFGLFEARLTVAGDRALLVRPAIQRLRRLYLRPQRVGAQAGAYAARVGGPGKSSFTESAATPTRSKPRPLSRSSCSAREIRLGSWYMAATLTGPFRGVGRFSVNGSCAPLPGPAAGRARSLTNCGTCPAAYFLRIPN